MIRNKIRATIQYADTQEVVVLPANVRRVRITPLTQTNVRFAFNAGFVEAAKGYEVEAGRSVDTGWMANIISHVYLLSFIPGSLVLVETFTSDGNDRLIEPELPTDIQGNSQLRSLPT